MSVKLSQFSISQSLLSGLDPRWKLPGIFFAALAVAIIQYLPAGAAALAGALVFAAVARLPWRWYLARIGAVAVFVAWFLVILPVLLPGPAVAVAGVSVPRGLAVAFLICVKAFAIVTLVLVQLGTTPLPTTLKAAHALRVPGLLIQLAMLAYRYTFGLAGELTRLRTALRVRGFRAGANRRTYRTIGQVSGTLLVKSYEQAERIGQAMRCRGFTGEFRSLAEFRTKPADVLFFCVLTAVAGATLGWSLLEAK